MATHRACPGLRSSPPVPNTPCSRRGSVECLRDELDVLLRADHQRTPLVQLGRLDIENAIDAVGRCATGLLRDERHRIGFVGEPELAPGVLAVARIEEDSARDEVAVEVGDQRADVAAVLGPVSYTHLTL